MIPSFLKVHNKFKLNRECFNHIELKDVAYSFVKEGEPFSKIIGNFLLDWLDNNDYVFVKTSGSTGIQKKIRLEKQAMVNSAIATGNHFNLKPGSRALHCLPTEFIAGKMMFVRAIILGLELDVVKPSSCPLVNIEKNYDFCAMLPMQVQNSFTKLHKIKALIVGGAPVSYSLKEKLRDISTKVYETYGMTETITHIAIKPLNHFNEAESYFNLLSDILIAVDDRNCLVIDAPKLNAETIITNDVVKLHSKTEFEIVGRIDNMINSGGLKLFPEQIEAKLYSNINQRFFIASEKDETLGDRIILVLEGESNVLDTRIYEYLDKYEMPKQVYAVNHFKETPTGKIQRLETLKMLK